MSKYNSYTTQAIINILNASGKGASFALSEDSIQWNTALDTYPSDEEIIAEQTRLEAEWKANEYQRLRLREYPSMSEQLDMQYHDSVNGTTTWLDAINAVKAKYPKP